MRWPTPLTPIIIAKLLGGGGGSGSVTPASVLAAMEGMDSEQQADAREAIGAADAATAIPTNVKLAFLEIFKYVSFEDNQGPEHIEDLFDALFPAESISAVYTQSGVVYNNDSLDSLKTDLVVTATYEGGYTAVLPASAYTLSGTLTVGTSTITVTYKGKTDTFTVTVTQARTPIAAWDFTSSLVDSVGGLEFALSNSNGGDSLPTRDSSGLHFTAAEQVAICSAYSAKYKDDRLYEFDVASAAFAGDTSKHKRLFGFDSSDFMLIYRNAGAVQIYAGGWKTYTAESGETIPTTLDALSGKTVGVKLGSDGVAYLYINGNLIGKSQWWSSVSRSFSSLKFGGLASGTAADGNDIHNITITGLRVYQEV